MTGGVDREGSGIENAKDPRQSGDTLGGRELEEYQHLVAMAANQKAGKSDISGMLIAEIHTLKTELELTKKRELA